MAISRPSVMHVLANALQCIANVLHAFELQLSRTHGGVSISENLAKIRYLAAQLFAQWVNKDTFSMTLPILNLLQFQI